MSRQMKWKVALAAVGVILALVLLYLALAYAEKAQVTEKPVAEEHSSEADRLLWNKLKLNGKKYRYSSDYETYLFIGTDESSAASDEEDRVANMADFLLLAVINRTERTIGFLQLNRDTIAEIDLVNPDGSSYASAEQQLCTAYWYGVDEEAGCENTVKAVSRLLGGLHIDGYYNLNMADIGTLNHAVGGVAVTIESDFSDVDPTLKQGETITLDDEQAETFVRSRMKVDDGENLSRMKRQKQYMEAMMKKVTEESAKDAGFALNVYEALADVAVTNMSGGLISDLAVELNGAENAGILEIEGEARLGTRLGDGMEHMEYYPTKMGIANALEMLYNIVDIE